MREVSISGSIRENVGKKDAKKLRARGDVPCVLYGGKEQVTFYTSAKSFKDIIYTPEVAFINIDIDDKKYHAVLKEAQFHPVTDNILHADFQELIEGKEFSMAVPVKLIGQSEGVKEGGVVQHNLRRLNIKAIPKNMPQYIEVDISDLMIGDSVKVADLEIEDATILDFETSVVVAVNITRVVSGAAEETMLVDDDEATVEDEAATEGEETPAEGEEAAEGEEDKGDDDGDKKEE